MTTQSATVLLISFAFHPSNEIGARRVTALARYLANNGIRVVVISAFGDQPIAPGSELYPGVIAVPVERPKRVWLDLLVTLKRRVSPKRETARDDSSFGHVDEDSASPRSGAAPLARLGERYLRLVYVVDAYKKWAWMAARAAVRAGRQFDVTLLLASGPPNSSLLAGAWAARKLGIPYVADLRDPFSDDPERRHEFRLLRVLERWIMRSAAAVTFTSATHASLLAERNKDLAGKIHVIRNGYDGAVAPPLTATGGRLSILFAGVLYRGRNPFPLLAALEELLSQRDVDPARIRLTFMGSKVGRYSDQALATWIRNKRCAAVVRILPTGDSAEVAQEVAQATVLLNLAQQGLIDRYVPAKTYEQLARGREVLLICECDSEPAQIAAGIRGVVQVDQSNPQVLLEVLRDLYNRHVVAGTASVPTEAEVRRFSRAFSNERFYALLTSVAPLRPPPERPPGVPQASAPSNREATLQPRVSLSQSFHRFAAELLADSRFYHTLTRAGRTDPGSLLLTMLGNRGLWLLTFHRIAHFCQRRRNRRSPVWWIARLCKSVGTCFSVLFCRSQLNEDCEIGAGTYLSNRGYLLCGALTIGAGSVIHDRCTFGRAVAKGDEGRPNIGKNVWIGPNCIIVGELSVGDGATVLPNSVLTFSVPAGAVVKGNPARIVRTDFDNTGLRRSLTIVPDVTTQTA